MSVSLLSGKTVPSVARQSTGVYTYHQDEDRLTLNSLGWEVGRQRGQGDTHSQNFGARAKTDQRALRHDSFTLEPQQPVGRAVAACCSA